MMTFSVNNRSVIIESFESSNEIEERKTSFVKVMISSDGVSIGK